MGERMKTTIEIDDALLRRAKLLAAKQDSTLKTVFEAALRAYLERPSETSAPFQLRKHAFGGRGLQPGLDEADWAAIRERAYNGRGG